VKPRRIARGQRFGAGLVLTEDVRDGEGRIAIEKGRVLAPAEVPALDALPWTELHVLELDANDVHEEEAGRRLSAAVAGPGVLAQPMSGGACALTAAHRGLFDLDEERLARVNAIEDLVVYAHPRHYVALEGELLGRAKIIPFATAGERIRRAEEIAAGGILSVRRFVAGRAAVLVQENIPESQLLRARAAFEEKLAFFGSELVLLERVPSTREALAASLRKARGLRTQLVVIAGSKPMDPLDPALQALDDVGARMESRGVPAHPGTLLWLAFHEGTPVLGAPSCGLFSKATALDLVLPRLLTGEALSRAQLAGLGAGGLLTRDMAFRFPPYRPASGRGMLDAE
jgi:molybdopterin biosynthesis enzyme